MKVSILMPCYNAGKYLKRAVESVQASTMQDFEIIILDDGSTDDTFKIGLNLRSKDNRIRVYRREEKGFAVTFNELLDKAKGEFVMNVDPDDWIDPTTLETMLEWFDDDTDFVKCGFWFEYPERSIKYQYTTEPAEFCPRKLPPDAKMAFFASQVAIWSMVIRRSFIEKHHIRLNPTPGAAYQDTFFVWQLNTLAEKVRLIPDKLYHYNKANENASTKSPRYPFAPAVEYGRITRWCFEHPEYGIYVRSVLCRARFGSYLWNMTRINRKDRPEFAKLAQADFEDDWNYIDVRMFGQREYDIFMTGKDDPESFIEIFNKGEDNANTVSNADDGQHTDTDGE